jgi:hypothetical protein
LSVARPGAQVFFDETVNGLLSTSIYFSAIPVMEGKSLPWVRARPPAARGQA